MNLVPFIAFGILIVGFGLVLLARPSLYLNLRHVRNTFNPNLLNSPFYRVQTRAFGLVLTLFGLDLAFAVARKASAFFATLQEVLHVTLFIVFFAIWIGTVLLWVLEKLKVIRPPLKERYDAASPELDVYRQHKETVVFLCVLAGVVLIAALVTFLATKVHGS